MNKKIPDQSDNKSNTSEFSIEPERTRNQQNYYGHDPKTLPYWKDPEFQKVLSDYQKAEWEICLKGINKFQKLYPDDKYLSEFKKEVEIRSNLHGKRNKQQGKENRTELRKKSGWILIIIIVIFSTGWGYFQYQNKLIKEQQTIDAINLSQVLNTKMRNAENLMQAGKPEEAILLYKEIQQVNPSFTDINLRIEQAEVAIAIENLYQEGILAEKEGNLDQALSTFLEVDSLSPQYKDTEYLISKIKIQQQIDILIINMKDSYSNQDWLAVAKAYESIQQLDPSIELSNENKELLFVSLHDLVIQTVDKGSLTLEEIESAVRYYQMAIALFPQDKKFTVERENLHKTTTELLINKYYLYAINLLEDSNYNSRSLNEAIRILTQVESISGGSETITQGIKKTKLFLDSYNQFLNKKYDQAIKGFEELRKLDPDYAGGKVNYLLIESYVAFGDILYKYADFAGARDQYLEAEKYTWSDRDHVIRLFLVELKVAKTLNRLWATDDSASYYHYAFGLMNFKNHLIDTNNQNLLLIIDNANAAFNDNKMRDAITLFELAVEEKNNLFDSRPEKVLHGDSLPDIAFQYGCTIEILRSINAIGDILIIQLDQELLIPIY